VFLQGAKVELGFHHCHHISPFVTTSTYLYIHHIHTPTIFHHTSTTYIGPHTCTSWFDHMTHFSGSMVWLYNICLQVCMNCLPTYELHISLLVIGWERRHNATMPNAKNTTYLEWREKAYIINALVRIHKYHK
jgi:hypothetical protein